jgi:hypothetical protein
MAYVIVTGYYAPVEDGYRSSFFGTWNQNTYKYSSPKKMFVVNSDGWISYPKYGEWINLTDNLGHVHHLINSGYTNKFCGWTMSTIIGALVAYSCRADMIFKEQDCLAFGPWVNRMYTDLENQDKDMLVGKSDMMGIEQSLFIIRNSFLLDYVMLMLSMPESDAQLLPEAKFQRMINDTGRIGYLSFGCGRNRPINYDEDVFYAQQISTEEMKILKEKNLV